MPTSYVKLKPVEWTQEIRSSFKIEGSGRHLRAMCTADELILSNGSNLRDFSVHVSLLRGKPTAANGSPLERGIGQLFYLSSKADDVSSNDIFVHGWYFLTPENYSSIWDQVSDTGYADCLIDLHIGPIDYSGEDAVWHVGQPLFIDDATIHFTRKHAPEEPQPRRQRLFGKS